MHHCSAVSCKNCSRVYWLVVSNEEIRVKKFYIVCQYILMCCLMYLLPYTGTTSLECMDLLICILPFPVLGLW